MIPSLTHIAAASAVVLALSPTAFAQQTGGTADEAKAMLVKAVAAVTADKAKALVQQVAPGSRLPILND